MNSHLTGTKWRHQLPSCLLKLMSLLTSTLTAQLPHLRVATCTYIRNNSKANKCQKCLEKIILCRTLPRPPLAPSYRSEGDATAQTF